ncbi:MAG: type II toxin-antitoxin system Phd/YefM family antitoxin [Actinomycetota bacterium]|jgi:prevent-host-death family protein|nr:type II toxin-antitoxin system Phd/YefM family antitoxin [Euzebyaceae bacterium]MDQ3452776.1 type II toxin-antitoxin system Phd/YefM family antitoxin [Actinomycetota bacterium]
MAKVIPAREFRANLAELLDDVAARREHVTITRHGRPEAVLVPADEYAALEETAEILSDSGTLEAIRTGLQELAAGEIVPLEDVRNELRAKRQHQ